MRLLNEDNIYTGRAETGEARVFYWNCRRHPRRRLRERRVGWTFRLPGVGASELEEHRHRDRKRGRDGRLKEQRRVLL